MLVDDGQNARQPHAAVRRASLMVTSPADFVARAAHHISELNAIHPFREGNGRTQRAFLFVLGRQAGHEIDLSKIDPQVWNDASRESFRTDDSKRMHDVMAHTAAR